MEEIKIYFKTLHGKNTILIQPISLNIKYEFSAKFIKSSLKGGKGNKKFNWLHNFPIKLYIIIFVGIQISFNNPLKACFGIE